MPVDETMRESFGDGVTASFCFLGTLMPCGQVMVIILLSRIYLLLVYNPLNFLGESIRV